MLRVANKLYLHVMPTLLFGFLRSIKYQLNTKIILKLMPVLTKFLLSAYTIKIIPEISNSAGVGGAELKLTLLGPTTTHGGHKSIANFTLRSCQTFIRVLLTANRSILPRKLGCGFSECQINH